LKWQLKVYHLRGGVLPGVQGSFKGAEVFNIIEIILGDRKDEKLLNSFHKLCKLVVLIVCFLDELGRLSWDLFRSVNCLASPKTCRSCGVGILNLRFSSD
jgi:hypothetical protein